MHEQPAILTDTDSVKRENPLQWEIFSKQEVETLVNELGEALFRKDVLTLQKIYENPKNLHSLVVSRGKKNFNLDLLENGFNFFIEQQHGPGSNILALDQEGNYRITGKDVIHVIHEHRLSEQVFNELISAAYHKRDGATFFRLQTLITESVDDLQNKEVTIRARHDLATWMSSEEHHPEKSLALNKGVLEDIKKNGIDSPVLETKARMGMTKAKNLKPGEKAETYDRLAGHFKSYGIEYEAFRTQIEAAQMYVALAKRQVGNPKMQEERMYNLGTALTLAQEVAGHAGAIAYANLEVLAHRVLCSIFVELGDKNTAKKHANTADGLARRFLYKTHESV